MAKQVYPGQWWCPTEPENKVAGTLYLDESGPRLELLGFFTEPSTSMMPSLPSRTILGHSGGQGITLAECFITSYTEGPQTSSADLSCRFAFIGALLSDDQAQKFSRIRFRVEHLDNWAGRRPFRRKSEDGAENARFEYPEVFEAVVPGASISLARDLVVSTSRISTLSLESHEVLTVQATEPRSIYDLDYFYVRPIEHLLDLAAVESAKAFDLEVFVENASGSHLWAQVHMAGESINSSSAESVHPSQMLFGMDSLGFRRAIEAWFAVEDQCSDICDLLFSLSGQSTTYATSQAFEAFSALEGMHRRVVDESEPDVGHKERLGRIYAACDEGDREWLKGKLQHSHQVSYATRLKELHAEAGGAAQGFAEKPNKWVRYIVDTRNQLAHQFESESKILESPEKLVFLTWSARAVLSIVLAKRLGFDDADCVRMFQYQPNWKHRAAMIRHYLPELFSRFP
ncbi:HEPN domain-containing protein [Streptomyces sp. NPDC059752]|uniref:ApeA N-terminal domain 1-containing protein n=1 Tax=unclassified Streptomyces TaxID=2593676 RepID=UPI0036583C79